MNRRLLYFRSLHWPPTIFERAGASGWGPLFFVAFFIAASYLMIWRLECLTKKGMEGTVLGTLVMPYCSGIGNLVFVFVLASRGGPASEVITNSLVNNVTNLTLLIGLPAVFWGLTIIPSHPGKKKKKIGEDPRINRLSLLLTLSAALFFSGALWALARDRQLDFGDGLVLVGLFLFWQIFHLFDVLKNHVRQNRSFHWSVLLDFMVLGIGAYGIYLSVDWLVAWISRIETGFISAKRMGWLSGWLMVLPNGLLALYYGWRKRADIVYSSQVGDGHICIPLCVGISALFKTISVPAFFEIGILLIVIGAGAHFLFLALFGQLPRPMGWLLSALYALFLYQGLF